MIERQKWTAHQFNLDIDPEWSHNIIGRLNDNHIRLRHHCQHLSDADSSKQLNGKWSIKEHIGHLIDLEDIHIKRLKEFSEFKKTLTGADMSNAKTEKANHNAKNVNELINEFEKGREHFIQVFFSLNEKCQTHKAEHPRLKAIMKPVDLMFFVAEHDDHHIASILEIIKS